MKFKSKDELLRKIKGVVINEDRIKEAVKKAGKYIDSIYDGTPILLVSILKGAFVFLADICREVTVPCEIGFMAAQSYFDGTESTGDVVITMDLKQDVSLYHVVIVEDIIDTGRTLNKIAELIREKKPKSLKILTLLDKPDRRVVKLDADYSLFTIPDLFVIGYGLDYSEYYRNLSYIAELDDSE